LYEKSSRIGETAAELKCPGDSQLGSVYEGVDTSADKPMKSGEHARKGSSAGVNGESAGDKFGDRKVGVRFGENAGDGVPSEG
jgi:hypothetical protein